MTRTSIASIRDAIRAALAAQPDVAYAIVFGSSARGDAHAASDIDVAVGFGDHARRHARRSALEIGSMVSVLEDAVGRSVDLVLLDEASPGLAFRVFRDGEPVLVRDRAALVERKARAILEYIDFEPVERACTEGVLRRQAR
jgi:predicted nucleotidyltransferase